MNHKELNGARPSFRFSAYLQVGRAYVAFLKLMRERRPTANKSQIQIEILKTYVFVICRLVLLWLIGIKRFNWYQ